MDVGQGGFWSFEPGAFHFFYRCSLILMILLIFLLCQRLDMVHLVWRWSCELVPVTEGILIGNFLLLVYNGVSFFLLFGLWL